MGWGADVLLPLSGASEPQIKTVTTRFKGPTSDSMDDEQRSVYDMISSVDRGAFGPLLASAPLAKAAHEFGNACLQKTSLTKREVTIIALAAAYHSKSSAEWSTHVQAAREHGLEEKYIASLARGTVPQFEKDSRDSAIYTITADLLLSKRVSAGSYLLGVAALGEAGVVEAVSTTSYFLYMA